MLFIKSFVLALISAVVAWVLAKYNDKKEGTLGYKNSTNETLICIAFFCFMILCAFCVAVFVLAFFGWLE